MRMALIAAAIVMTAVGYFFYFRDILAGRTRPHAYSWLVWAFLTGVAFTGQLRALGGPGSYVTGITAAISLIIFLVAIVKGEKNVTASDTIYLAAAAASILPWALTGNPVLSIILVSIIDFLGFLPTIRKSYFKPHEETMIHYVLSSLKFTLAIFGLGRYTLVTVVYPASVVVANMSFVFMLIGRRKKLARCRE